MKLGIAATFALYLIGTIGVVMIVAGIWFLIRATFLFIKLLRERRREPTTDGDDGGRLRPPLSFNARNYSTQHYDEW